jgi:hypothetical protein
MNEFKNLGVLPSITTPVVIPTTLPKVTLPAVTQPAPPQVPWYQKISNATNSILDVANKTIDTVQNIKGGTQQNNSTHLQIQQQQQALQQQQQSASMNNLLKIALGTLAAGTLGFIVYKATSTKGKKSLNGVDGLDTAKTVKGKAKQRAAVFAKLEDEGKAFPKNKSGVRKPVRKSKKAKARRVKI